jgi:hypothetical protein
MDQETIKELLSILDDTEMSDKDKIDAIREYIEE